MTYVHAGAGTLRPPGAQADLQVEFSRNPAAAPINQYLQRVPSVDRAGDPQTVGLFARFDPDQRVRVPNGKPNWPDGEPRPAGFRVKHEWVEYRTGRHTEPFSIGTRGLSVDQIGTLSVHARTAAERIITRKTLAVETVLTDPAVVPYADVRSTTEIGGALAGSTTSNLYIKKAFDYAVTKIQENTRGAIRHPSQIRAIMSRETALAIGSSPEYFGAHQYVNGPDYVRRAASFDEWGLTGQIYGIPYTVHDDMIITSEEGAASTTLRRFFEGLGTKSTVPVHNPIVFVYRAGQLDAAAANGGDSNVAVNTPAPSAITEIYAEDMTVEAKTDDWNRITHGAVTSDFVMALTSPKSVFMLTDVLGEEGE